MATAELPNAEMARDHAEPRTRGREASSPLMAIWSTFASLKLTVVLLTLLILLVFAGTLAQAHRDVWYVMKEGYFRVWIAQVDWQIFPTLWSVFSSGEPIVLEKPHIFYFPGGYTIGLLMAINLLAAHTLRYKIRARGTQLVWALGLLAVGVVVTWLVIAQATSNAHQASISPRFADLLWNLSRGAFAALGLVSAYLLSLAYGRLRRPEWWVLAGLNAVALVAAAFLFLDPEWRIPDAGMRIVWQLIQATAAGGLLMASLWLLFAKRSGVILLHIGVAILMAHEFYVAETNVEMNMIIDQGQTVDWAYSPTETELAVIDRSDAAVDHVTVIPTELLAAAAALPADAAGRVISHPDLPVDVRVVEYYANSAVSSRPTEETDESLKGAATQLDLEQKPANPKGDIPGAVVELLEKPSGKSLGKYHVTVFFDMPIAMRIGPSRGANIPGFPTNDGQQLIAGADNPLWLAMRFKRVMTPYEVTLEKFSFDKYAGTDKAKNYSSDIQLTDKQQGTSLEYHVSMNNPLRYEGETFYQSDFDHFSEDATVLQVVKNEGWMAPYIGCAVVMVGMLVHFGITLVRFLNRRLRELDDEQQPTTSFNDWALRPEVLAPAVVSLLVMVFFAWTFRQKPLMVGQMPVHEFAELPVLDEGRVKPYDTLARNTLQYFSQRQEAAVSEDGRQKIPASQWLLDLLAGKQEAADAYVFRITNLELLKTIDLPLRPGFFRYSLNEIEGGIDKLRKEVGLLEEADRNNLTRYQRDVLQLWNQCMDYVELANSFRTLQIRGPETVIEDLFMAARQAEMGDAPLSVPPREVDGNWFTLHEADLRENCYMLQNSGQIDPARMPPVLRDVLARFGSERPGAGIEPLARMLSAYHSGDSKAFKSAIADMRSVVRDYQSELEDPKNAAYVSTLKTAERLDTERLEFETWFNGATPFYFCAAMYFVALILSAASWLTWPKTLGRSAIAIIAVTLVVHTLAIAARVYISGRPPITNLYTTAICIGWAVVLLMLVFESIFKLGVGGFVASACGFATLLIAHFLGQDGDTFTVMQAVLDTQFWLTVHVLSINIGYATTMLAGCLGIVYIVAVHMLDLFSKADAKKLTAMIYGSLCFAILFSFFGTVLGGLWADDSWGRFWGWDPKENGALMIVLWNAVALHARWGKMIGPRGLAMLTVVGNIITAWSWFGVNQLSIGLHAYGFNENLARGLLYFIASQVAVLILGAIPWPKLISADRNVAKV